MSRLQVHIVDMCQKISNIGITEEAIYHIESFILHLVRRLCYIMDRYSLDVDVAIKSMFPGNLGELMTHQRELLCFEPDTFKEFTNTHQYKLAVAFEFFCHELLQITELRTMKGNRDIIIPKDIKDGIMRDNEMFYVFKTNNLQVVDSPVQIPHHPFKKIVKEIVGQTSNDQIKISSRATTTLQAVIEHRISEIIKRANEIKDSNRNKLGSQDIYLAYDDVRMSL